MAGFLRPGKYQPAQSDDASSAAPNHPLGHGCGDRYHGHDLAGAYGFVDQSVPEHFKATESERFISELGLMVGGYGIKLAVVLTASSLLLFAANTAIIGSYHVFLALVKGGFLPQIIAVRKSNFQHTAHRCRHCHRRTRPGYLSQRRSDENLGRYVCLRFY